jgi:hypothetical protein
VKEERPSRDKLNELVNQTRNEMQKAVLLGYVLEKLIEDCRKTSEAA